MMNMHKLEYVGVCLVFIYFFNYASFVRSSAIKYLNEQTPQLSYHYVK